MTSAFRIPLIGMSYQKNVEDTRESSSLRLIELIEHRGAKVHHHDPCVAAIPPTREHPKLVGRRSVALSAASLASYDAVVISTDHDGID